MAKPKIYIDGKEGTTGLQIYDRLAKREDIELLLIDEAKRKDTEERRKLIHAADIVFLCLRMRQRLRQLHWRKVLGRALLMHLLRTGQPKDGRTAWRNFQRSTARRSKHPAGWRIQAAHATGFITSVYPLVAQGIIPKDYPMTVFSLTGYSGGGKKMIAEYESPEKPQSYFAPRIYGLTLKHKHLPEMQKVCGLDYPPVFSPIVDDYYKGMAVTVMLQNSCKGKSDCK